MNLNQLAKICFYDSINKRDALDECDYVGEFDVDSFVGFYLVNNNAYHLKRLSVCRIT